MDGERMVREFHGRARTPNSAADRVIDLRSARLKRSVREARRAGGVPGGDVAARVYAKTFKISGTARMGDLRDRNHAPRSASR